MDLVEVDHAGTGRLSRQAYQLLRERILCGELASGVVLNEGKLASELDMSKTPIRHALRALHQEGFLQNGPRRQMVVGDFSETRREELVRVREALERIVVERACRTMSADQLDYLWTLLRRQRRAAEGGDAARFIRLDEELHLAIADRCELQIVPLLLRQLRGFVSLMQLNTRRDPGYMMRVVEEHRRIIEAIEARNESAALHELAFHLHTNQYIWLDSDHEISSSPAQITDKL